MTTESTTQIWRTWATAHPELFRESVAKFFREFPADEWTHHIKGNQHYLWMTARRIES